MKQLSILIFAGFLAFGGRAQSFRGQATADMKKKATTKDTMVERKLNFYANRKYSYGFSENFYGFHPNSRIFHATDIVVSDRMDKFDIRKVLSFEVTLGGSFQPYQGFRFHLGFDYEWITPTKVHIYFGAQYALGLQQRTIEPDHSFVVVGYHSYVVPFIGVMYWPGKRDLKKLSERDTAAKFSYYNPTFWQLVYIKGQVAYSSLFSNLTVDPSETFNGPVASSIRQNVSSGLYLSLGVGINLPTFGKAKLADRRQLEKMGQLE